MPGALVEGISIFDAVRSGSPELLQKSLMQINATDVYRNLHFIFDVPEITRMLIERGANVHATSRTNRLYTVQFTNDENVEKFSLTPELHQMA